MRGILQILVAIGGLIVAWWLVKTTAGPLLIWFHDSIDRWLKWRDISRVYGRTRRLR